MAETLLKLHDFSLSFETDKGPFLAVDKISFSLDEGKSLAIVGESGSGKSVTALSLTRLLPSPPATYSGEILFQNRSVLQMNPAALRKIRGGGIAYIFQEPTTSLNPVYSIRTQIVEALGEHRPDVRDIDQEVLHWLDAVGIHNAAARMRDYPHQLSGGMQQRVMIAMALACKPKLLVADEPTTALDVTIQAQILKLLHEIRSGLGMSLILITHNFAIIQDLCDEVAVMFRGRIVESGETKRVLKEPQHPYTRALLSCVPRLGSRKERLHTIDYSQFVST
ncbi:MAG: peptide ABC transporter ATP-binding protein [Verrucomicrobia bacterium]|nr:MAG: peptide ABC transporter ATP-binding protein [Verrucomicrobiota bacterium]